MLNQSYMLQWCNVQVWPADCCVCKYCTAISGCVYEAYTGLAECTIRYTISTLQTVCSPAAEERSIIVHFCFKCYSVLTCDENFTYQMSRYACTHVHRDASAACKNVIASAAAKPPLPGTSRAASHRNR